MNSESEELLTVVVGEPAVESAQPAPQVDWPVDGVCADAVELARDALLEETQASNVGDHEGLIADGPLVVTHYFAGHVPGYVGWRWAVTLTRAPDSEHVTVDETALIPAGNALLAPAWVPWKHRIRSGDLGAGDVLVTEQADPRLVPGMTDNDVPQIDDDALRPQQWERGLGRVRILSPEGRREAAHRWYRETGPRSQIARSADLECASCGFLLLIGGPLGQAFGVCANGYSPVDGRIVAMDFGCGAHSETPQNAVPEPQQPVVDETGYVDTAEVPDPPEAVEVAEPQADASEQQPSEQPEAAPDEQSGEQPADHDEEVVGDQQEKEATDE